MHLMVQARALAKTTPTTCQGHLCACIRAQQAGSGTDLALGSLLWGVRVPAARTKGYQLSEGGQCLTRCGRLQVALRLGWQLTPRGRLGAPGSATYPQLSHWF